MHLATVLFFLTALISTASAWNLVLTMKDTRTATMHGTLPHDCQKLDLDMSSPVVTASFVESFWVDTFELWANADCTGRVFREGDGTHPITLPFKVLAYKIK